MALSPLLVLLLRTVELLTVINVLFGLSVVATYELDFVDEVDISMPVDTLRSNLHFVQSWLCKSYAGHVSYPSNSCRITARL